MADRPSPLDEYLHTERNRPLGDLKVQSNVADFRAKQVADAAANNLLAKATRDLAAGNISRAEMYIEKAARLSGGVMGDDPGLMGWMVAQVMLFTRIAEEVEDADPGDGLWLDWASTVVEEGGEFAALAVKFALNDVANDYGLEPKEKKRVRAITGGEDRQPEIERLVESDEASAKAVIRQTLDALVHYERLAESRP